MRYDVYGIGNALVDSEFEVPTEALAALGIDKGVMTLVDKARQDELIAGLEGFHHARASGGSAANSIIAVAQFGGKAFYSCKVADDETGDFYLRDLRACGVDTNISDDHRPAGDTGRCLVLVTPDADRTMNTYLGITGDLSEAEIDEQAIAASQYVYLEGYLVSAEMGRRAAVHARRCAELAGVKTALSLSDPNMVQFFRDGMLEMLGSGVDLLFCNEAEACLMAEVDDIPAALEKLKSHAKQICITLGGEGALLWDGEREHRVAAHPVTPRDSNGAGDMFAGAFLYGLTQGMDFPTAGALASRAAAEVVTHFGPRLPIERSRALLAEFG
jgi:fructokinase